MYMALGNSIKSNVLCLYNIFHVRYTERERAATAGCMLASRRCEANVDNTAAKEQKKPRRNVNKTSMQVFLIPSCGLWVPVVELTSSSRIREDKQGKIHKIGSVRVLHPQHGHGSSSQCRPYSPTYRHTYYNISVSVLFQGWRSSFVIRQSWSVASCKFLWLPFSLLLLLLLLLLLSTWWRQHVVAFVCVKRSSI